MTKDDLLHDAAALGQAFEAHVRCLRNSLPTLTAVAVAIASTVVLTLSGCADSSGIVSSAKPIDPASVGLDTTAAAPAVSGDWWKGLGDPTLNGMVEQALSGNPNIRIAQARFEQARAGVAGARSADGLHVNGEADVTRTRLSANGIYPPPLGGGTFTIGTTEVTAGYDFDFFGRNGAAIEAALGNQRAAQAETEAARIMLASNVARAYVQLARLFAQRDVALRSLEQRDQILALVRQRVAAGLDTNVELRQGEESLPESRQQIEQLDEQIAMTRHALAALTAQPPNAFDALEVRLDAVRLVPVPETIPADMLGRRADISAARWRIEAATANVRNAKAGFYPNVNLSAMVGLNSIGLDNLFKSSSRQWSAAPAITLPIFDQGRLRANLSGRAADLDAAVESYNQAVLDAVRDAADQISSVRSIERQQTQQAQAQAAAESAYDLATQRYKAGLGTYLTVLNAEATVLAQRRLAADLKARAIDVQIALVRALGGGYTELAPTRTAAAGQ
ncbi:MAG: efflux transporter outer membrane subunit [Pseudomonadota bacterium]|nr:efflux transporter outer membrane subunit [Pseudomonadota bacterium]